MMKYMNVMNNAATQLWADRYYDCQGLHCHTQIQIDLL